jgi:hypothetical protein
MNLKHLYDEEKIKVDHLKLTKEGIRDKMSTKDGQIDDWQRLNGIGRKKYDYLGFDEGKFVNDVLHGYGRTFWNNGTYYVGEWK